MASRRGSQMPKVIFPISYGPDGRASAVGRIGNTKGNLRAPEEIAWVLFRSVKGNTKGNPAREARRRKFLGSFSAL